MIKISGKREKITLTTDAAMTFFSFFKLKKLFFFLNKERNIIAESVVTVGLSTFPQIFIYMCFFFFFFFFVYLNIKRQKIL